MTPAKAISRRDLLRVAAVGAGAALVGGCTSDSSPAASPTTPTPSTPSPSGVSPSSTAAPSWADLRSRMTGHLVLPGDTAYGTARLSANPRYDSVHPVAVAQCATAADVGAVVAFARDQRVPFTVRSGGHSYIGASTGPNLVLDISAIKAVQPDAPSRTVRVGAGARLVDVFTGVAAHGLGIAAGSCPTVGLAGLTLGGGVGVLTRSWGLTCDAIDAYEIVTADGKLRTVDRQSDPDLFWAGQGGGGGSFGVVTGFTLAARPAPDLTIFALHWPSHAAANVIEAWQRWGPITDERCWSTCKIHAAPGAAASVLVAGVWNGPDASLAAVLAPLLSAVGTATSSRSSRRHSYLDTMLSEAGCSGAGCHLPPAGNLAREALAATSHVPTGPMSLTAAGALVAAVQDAAGTPGIKLATASLDALGGAVAQRPAAATAFVHRNAPFTVQYTATWADNAVLGNRFDAAVRAMRATMTPYLGTGAYVNYCDSSLLGWETAYWGANYPRLQAVKRAVDPDDVFSGLQSVRP